MFTLTIRKEGYNGGVASHYTMAELRKTARSAVAKRGKVHAITVQVNQDNGHVSLHASYTQPDGIQTFTSVAI